MKIKTTLIIILTLTSPLNLLASKNKYTLIKDLACDNRVFSTYKTFREESNSEIKLACAYRDCLIQYLENNNDPQLKILAKQFTTRLQKDLLEALNTANKILENKINGNIEILDNMRQKRINEINTLITLIQNIDQNKDCSNTIYSLQMTKKFMARFLQIHEKYFYNTENEL